MYEYIYIASTVNMARS